MSEEQLKAFWEAIKADAGLQQKLQGVTEPDAIAAIAKEAGFSISAEEIKKAQSGQLKFAELTDEQLEKLAAAGGSPATYCYTTC
jgi:predicted ribosomally synthesized peptide with nif11-like leader